MFRFRTFYNVLKRNTACQLTQARGSRNTRDERPDDARKIQLWNKEQRKEKEARKKAETVSQESFLFTDARNLSFVKCQILNHRVMGAFYMVTVKETKAEYDRLQNAEKNYKSVKSVGKHAKVSFGIAPTDLVKIQELDPSRKYDRIYFIDPTQEGEMKKFFEMCASMLCEKGEIQMILDEDVFKSLKIEDVGKEVNIVLKKKEDFHAGYCTGYTVTHTDAEKAKIFTFEFDKTKKTSEDQECNNADLVAEPMSSLADNHNAVESGCSSEVGQWNLMYLACGTELKLLSQHVQLHYQESGRSFEVDPSVDQWNMVYLNMINARPNEQAVGCLACASLEENQLPPVTFNFPGAVEGTNICHPAEFDLYFSSHAGIQGTGGLTHTHAEDKFNADGLQILTPSCYMYARSTSSDSIGGTPYASIVQRAYYAYPAAVIPMVSLQQ